MKNPLFWLLLPVSVLAVLFLGAIFLTVLAFLPGPVTAATLAILALAAAWFVLVRRRSGTVPSEGSIMGRQKSVEGLL